MDVSLLTSPGDLDLAASGGTFPHRRVNLGLVGLNFGRHLIDEILSKRNLFDLTALCDLNEFRLAQARQKHDVTCHGNFDAMLEDPKVEAIGLFTSPKGRAELIRRALRAGRHVLTTKPLEVDPAAALEVLREARRRERVVHCNSPSPLPTNEIKIIEAWQHEYGLGQPVGARADVWVSYRELPDGSWYDDPRSCPAAPVFRLGIYLINDLVRLWGPVERVQVMRSRLFTQRPTTDNAQVGLLFANGAIANIYASFCVEDGDYYRNGMVLNFERGTIYRNTGPAWPLDPGVRSRLALVQLRHGGYSVVADSLAPMQSGDYQWEYFARAVRGERQGGELTPEQMVEGIRVMKAISEAELGDGTALVTR